MVTCLPFLILPDVFSGALGLEQDSALPSCQGHCDPSTLNSNVLLCHAGVTFLCAWVSWEPLVLLSPH